MAGPKNNITIGITAQSSGLNRGLKNARGQLTGFQQTTRAASIGLGTLVKGFALVGGASAVKNFLGSAISEAREAQKVTARTNNVIQTTGGVANVTAKQVGNLATSISNKTAVDDEAIQTGANLLLTFTKVHNEAGKGNDVFNQATAAAVDLSAAGFGSVDSASKSLGKALDDPLKGLASLGKQGVSFTQQQKDQVKALVESGNVLGAQKIILKEVQTQVGGAAAAQATAGERLRVTVDNIKESIGARLLPVIDRMATYLADNLPGALASTAAAFGKVKSAVQAVTGFLTQHRTAIAVTAGVIGAVFLPLLIQMGVQFALQTARTLTLNAAFLAYGIVVKATAIATRAYTAGQWLLNAALTANPIGLVIVAIVALVAAVVIAYKKSETFRTIVQAALAGVKVAAIALKNGAVAAFGAVVGAVKTVGSAAVSAYNAVKSAFSNAVSFVKSIPNKIKTALGNVKDLLLSAGREIIAGLLRGITEKLQGLYDKVAGIGKKIKSLKGPLSYDKVMLKPEGQAIIQGLIDGISSEEQNLYAKVTDISKNLAGSTFRVGDATFGKTSSAGLSVQAGTRGGNVYNINVHLDASMTVEQQGREYKRAIRAAELAGVA